VERLYSNYLRLSGLGNLCLLYEEFKHSLPAILRLYDNLRKEKKLSNDDIKSVINHSAEIPWLKIRYRKLVSNIEDLKNKKMVCLVELCKPQESLSNLKSYVAQIKNSYSYTNIRIKFSICFWNSTMSIVYKFIRFAPLKDGAMRITTGLVSYS
jgi:hypothetical protein